MVHRRILPVARRTLIRNISNSGANWTETLVAEKDVFKRKEIVYQNIFSKFHNAEDIGKSEWLYNALNKAPNGIQTAMSLREDSLHSQKLAKDENSPKWAAIDKSTKRWLSTVFCEQALDLKRITFEESSADVLEQVARGEAVHRVRSLSGIYILYPFSMFVLD